MEKGLERLFLGYLEGLDEEDGNLDLLCVDDDARRAGDPSVQVGEEDGSLGANLAPCCDLTSAGVGRTIHNRESGELRTESSGNVEGDSGANSGVDSFWTANVAGINTCTGSEVLAGPPSLKLRRVNPLEEATAGKPARGSRQ